MTRAVLFDLDGTLADTAQDLGAALNRLLQEYGKSPLPYASIRPVASHGARGLINLGFGIDRDHPEFESLRQRFLDHYDTGFADLTSIFDGINNLLQQLAQRNIAWGVVTNKPMRFTDRLVPALPWSVQPGVIVSGDTVGIAKPDPRPLLYAAEKLGVAPDQCIYLGDAERDVEAAIAAGMKPLIANYGYIADTDLPENWGAAGFIDRPEQLIDYL
ncbi:MAG: family hydrolase [Pseudomonadota bacterium]|nr:family hydrolase [Pseudomonadota bacterium]